MHLDQQRLARLLQGTLSQEAATEALGHIATCDSCALRIEALKRVRADFEGSWEEFAAWLAGPEAGGTAPAVDRPGRTAALDFAVRVLLDGRERIAAVGSRLAETLSASSLSAPLKLDLSYSGIGDSETSPGLNQKRVQASESLARADYPSAREALRELARLSSDAAAAATVEGGMADGVSLEVVADATRPALSVLLHVSPLPAVKVDTIVREAAAVLLDDAGREIRRESFRPVEGADYLLADFDQMEDGNWIIGIDLGRAD